MTMSGEEGGAELHRRLQRLELPWLDLRRRTPPPAHGRALWETELIGVGTASDAAGSAPAGVAVLVQRRARRRLPLPLPPGSSADLQDELSSIRVVTGRSRGSGRRQGARRARAAAADRAVAARVAARRRRGAANGAPRVGARRRHAAARERLRSGRLRHSAGADGGGGATARSDSLPKKSPRRHAPPDAHPVARQVVAHPPPQGSSASTSTASTPRDSRAWSCCRSARPRRRRRCRRCRLLDTDGRTCHASR